MFSQKSGFAKFTTMIFLITMLALVLAACGNDKNEGANSSQSANDNSDTRIVKTVQGDVEVPANPKRIVVDAYLPTLLLLGNKPVGATEIDLENVHIQDQIAGIESIGEGSLEKLLELQPDLIMNPDPALYEDLSKIAPTVVIPYESYKNVYEEVRGIAAIVGKEKEAEQWLAGFDEKMRQLRDKVSSIMDEGETVSVLGAYRDSYMVYGAGIYRGGEAIYTHLKLTAPDFVKKEVLDQGASFKQVSFELLPQFAGDYIFFDESAGGVLNREDKVWKSIDAVKNDRVFFLNLDRFGPFDPIAVQNQAEEVVNLLETYKKQHPSKQR